MKHKINNKMFFKKKKNKQTHTRFDEKAELNKKICFFSIAVVDLTRIHLLKHNI